MTEAERELCHQLVIHADGKVDISEEEFKRRFPSAICHGKLAKALLEEAFQSQNGDDLLCVMIIGSTFGFGPEHIDILCRLIDATWHQCHEFVVSALDGLRTTEAVDALFRATQWVPEYLDYDESRALAVKAIWGLGNLVDRKSEDKLKTLVHSEDAILRKAAVEQLKRRAEAT